MAIAPETLETLRKESGGEDLDLSWLDRPPPSAASASRPGSAD